MSATRTPHGTTLPELLLGLTLLGILLGLAMPPLKRALDEVAVRRARDALAAQVARTRALAVARGGARLVLDVPAAAAWVQTAGGETVGGRVDLAREYRVDAETDGAAERLELRFDALGVGRLANHAIRIRRGRAEAGLTISAYGRVRAW